MSSDPEPEWVDRILHHLADLVGGRSSLDEEIVASEPNPALRQIFAALLMTQEDLVFARAQQAEAVGARDEFLAIASHELRTPLATLSLDLRTLEVAEVPNPEVVIARLRRQVTRLINLVERMLDVSSVGRLGTIQMDPQPMDLAVLVKDVIDEMRPSFDQNGVPLVLRAPPSLPGVWDAVRLAQVLHNLLNNALKFGDDKPVEVELGGDDRRVVLRVRDHGLGIPRELREQVWGPFTRGTVAVRHEGLGLGLWLSQQIVRASGGRIGFVDVEGPGTCVEVELWR